MFIVSQAQITQLDSLYLDRLVREIKAHVADFFPEEYPRLAADTVNTILRTGVLRAHTYGLCTDRNSTVFVDFMMTFGDDFPEKQPWAIRILEDPDSTEDQKIDALLVAIDD